MEIMLLVSIILVGLAAGILGTLFGIGGGIIVIPVLTAIYGLGMIEAVGASLIGIVATSVGSSIFNIEKKVTNIRLGLFLEISTVIGSIIGVVLAGLTEEWVMMTIFAIVILLGAVKMILNLSSDVEDDESGEFSYNDLNSGKVVRYDVKNKKLGSIFCVIAGILSSMTGVGGGVVKVPVMNTIMNVPIKAAVATSSYMIGITAFSGAMLYFFKGDLQLEVAAFISVGALIGALIGGQLSKKFDGTSIKRYFSILMIIVAVVMILQAGGVI